MKLWLIGITTEGHEKDLRELIDPIKGDFDGLIWTFHYPLDSGYDYLCSVKGDGEIIKTKWCNRLDFSRNHCLFQGPMKAGDWFLTIDTLERLSPEFTKNLKSICHQLEQNNVDGCYLYNKRFMFRYNETMEFKGNPHEAMLGTQNSVELTNLKIWDKSFQKNVRSEKRQDPFHFVEHNFKYYLFPSTNHLFLGFENDVLLVKKRYENRMKFFQAIHSQGFDPYDYDSVKECLENHLDDTMKECINFDKFLNDWYRYEVLGEKEGIINKHDFSLIKPIF
tara:strand:+ start:46453 stop:47289 length:837 start_codon:yes stop_codon:yes gene_type:complete